VYRQHISTQLNVTTLQQIVPRCLDKPFLTSASRTYANKLKQRTNQATATPTPHQPLNRPPKSKIVKPVVITFAEAAAKNTPHATQTQPPQNTATPATEATKTATFDCQSELQQMVEEVKMTLQAKFDKVFEKMQKSLDTIENNVEKKIQDHMEKLQATQADRATQENHAKQLDTITRTLKILLHQVNTLLDQQNNPTPMNGVGDS